MSDNAFQTWDELAKEITKRLDLVAEGDEAKTREDATEELWNLVDAYDDRPNVGDFDEDSEVAEDVDTIDVEDIPVSLVKADPERATKLGRLVQLVNVGRRSNVLDVEDFLDMPNVAGTADDGEKVDSDEEIRLVIQEAIDDFREKLDDVRKSISETDGNEDLTGVDRDNESGEQGGERDRTNSGQSASGRGPSLSTVPTSRADMGTAHVSIQRRKSPRSYRRRNTGW